MGQRWAIVLGVSSGFGAASARALARKGYPVYGVHLDRRSAAPRIEALLTELRSYGVPVHVHNGNAAKPETRSHCLGELSQAMAPGDTVGLLFHSLAFGTLRPFIGEDGTTIQPKHLDMTLDIMAHSLVYWVQDLVAQQLLTHGGRIVAMTSAGSQIVWPSYGAVSAAKCALESHIRQLALELAPKGITANAIMAGVCQTPALEKIPGAKAIVQSALDRNPSGRLTTVGDVAACLLALIEPGTQWMTGNVIRVDGGETLAG